MSKWLPVYTEIEPNYPCKLIKVHTSYPRTDNVVRVIDHRTSFEELLQLFELSDLKKVAEAFAKANR